MSEQMQEPVVEDAPSASAPPYVSWVSFQNLISRMEKEGVPARVDRGYLGGSGNYQSQMMAALRYLDLVDINGVPQAALREYVTEPDRRQAILADLLRTHYREMVDLGQDAIQSMLDQAFRDRGMRGVETIRKAQSFYLGAAKAAGIETSRFFKISRAASANGVRKRVRTRPAQVPEPAPQPANTPAVAGETGWSTLLKGLVERIPPKGSVWPASERDDFIELFKLIAKADYIETRDAISEEGNAS